MSPLKWIDIPPVWLVAFASMAWLQARYYPMGLHFGGTWADLVGGLLVGGGVLLMALAVYEMRRMKTTVIPHQDADTLVQSGIFSRTRNPIYLGDVMVLAGLVLNWNAVVALPLVPILLWVLEKRFVIPEENRLRRRFKAEFARYEQKVGRWM